ncbi:MAG TPA: hypothetical protein ENI17_13100 [Pseudomonas xinjiangensis]|uniref:Uncharacterized protein n=2 Tax=root TaxID=1 RepID=A0A7V1FSB6_9GAMM|nr:hypothetical protein [Halopseudomonas xinjiangensis]HEC48549.1 hypothetical protein [Halopseudomonas xinjiangensis]
MDRKQQISEIEKLDGQLSVEHGLLKLDGRKHMESIRNIPQLWVVGGGLALGLLIGLADNKTRFSLFSAGFKGLRIWHLSQLFGSDPGPALDADA